MLLDTYNQMDHPEHKPYPDSGLSAIKELDPRCITGVWKESSREFHKMAIQAVDGEDAAEMQIINDWVGHYSNSGHPLHIVSNNRSWKQRLKGMTEGRRVVPHRWRAVKHCLNRIVILNDLPSLEAIGELCKMGFLDGDIDAGVS